MTFGTTRVAATDEVNLTDEVCLMRCCARGLVSRHLNTTSLAPCWRPSLYPTQSRASQRLRRSSVTPYECIYDALPPLKFLKLASQSRSRGV